MKKLIIPCAISLFWGSCNNVPEDTKGPLNTDQGAPITAAPIAAPEPEIKTFTTKTGKVIILKEEHPIGMSLSNVTIGFAKDSLQPFFLHDIDPINKVLLGDLDGNGFEEIYIISTSAGSGSGGSIHGFASNRDKSLSIISIPEIGSADLAKGGKYEGYQGHDEINIIDNTLERAFPVKPDKSSKRVIKYKLRQGESGYQLIAISSNLN
ncbi:hypothetical protein [Flavihumibacter fluvii]|uniref:hypothetical protein n=1 Tax=Flavihumibacter fluvii TaxID=2838157 RepID=UPI001BDDEADD|nr:hypothetical protein [Flavihumibacter fluvii]ULQ52773.1 hypothetical protein KJS93_00365 [Flavihumibacter fluvii]